MSMLYFDPVTSDPPEVDGAYPPSYVGVSIPSAGELLHGVAYSAQGAGPHPVAVFLHGLPGHERNLDLAQAARRAGWTALTFSYRGAWGSGGQFTFGHALEDVQAALTWLRTDDARQLLRADGERVALIGISMGAWAALMTTAERSDLLGAAALAPWNVGAYAQLTAKPDVRPMALDFLAALSRPLQSLGADALLDELAAHQTVWDVVQHAAALREQRLLLVAGAEDDEAPPYLHYAPLVKALHGALLLQHHQIADADHAFSARRIELARLVIAWLDTLRRA
ncbi:MAG TPA: alpha/beta fold hydrolase [Candidatus Limnocylindrales bacterium]|nr:alpha/beta fold hydrolase [Candidatus Limnocylindrales bacterium]